jgi:hypothetical protein
MEYWALVGYAAATKHKDEKKEAAGNLRLLDSK